MKIAIIQICSKLNPDENLSKINSFINEVKQKDPKVKYFFLPEVFYSMSDGTKPTPYLIDGKNEHYKNIQNIAIDNEVYILGGTAATKVEDKILNRIYNFDTKGNELNGYDKIHLFAVNLKGNKKSTVIDESKVYSAGNELRTLDIEDFKMGMSVCFDLRFPEMFREYFKQGVNLLTISSAFTQATGKAHWETLVRARAIENQSYVIASNQWGQHNEKSSTFGHSMVVDPWGEVLVNCKEGECVKVVDINIEMVEKVRGRMNISPRF